MPFAKLTSDRTPEHVEETWALESAWSESTTGVQYYDTHVSVIRAHETAVPLFQRYLGQGGLRVLEAGCGTGRWLAYTATLGNHGWGVDHSVEQLRFAKTHAAPFQLCAGDVLALPFKDGSFDAVLSSYVAEHFPDGPGRALAEARRLLRPGGLLLFVVPYANPWRRLIVHPLLRLCYAVWRLRSRLRFTEYHFRRPEIEDAVRGAGFDILECHPDDYRPPWTKGLYCDAADLLGFALGAANPVTRRPFQFGRIGTALVRLAGHIPLWWYCEGILVIARRRDTASGGNQPPQDSVDR